MPRHSKTTRRGALSLLAAGTLASVLPAAGPAGRATAQHKPAGRDVDLHLALAVDASGSVNQVRFELQKRGYADAFANPRVLQAIRSGPQAAIAVTMYQWTGPELQAPVIPWTILHDPTTVTRLADDIQKSRRHLYGGGTSISGAIDYGMLQFPLSPFAGGRRVLDISGDGSNNRGRSVTAARDDAVADGININGLPILELEPYLEEYFRANVIGGPGAFVIAAETFQDFGNAILRKLILEIAGTAAPSSHSGQA